MKCIAVLVSIWFFGNFAKCYIVNPGPKYVATKGEVWPKPQHQDSKENYFVLTPRTFEFVAVDTKCSLLDNAFKRYFEILQKNRVHEVNNTESKKQYFEKHVLDEKYLGKLTKLYVHLNGSCDDKAYPTIDMDEKYTLSVLDGQTSNLTATSIWGILRGLETFSQLLYLGVDGSSVRVNATTIVDYPRFRHRGLLLDTSRHYLPVKIILQVIDGMAYNKMNVFHWHIVDDQSFPYVSRVFPELSQMGSYDPQFFTYTPENVQEIIEYARQRGIRVMPEFDTPGHTRSWGVSHPEILTKCDSVQKGSYGPIDPSKNKTYSVMKTLLTEIRSVFKDQFIHLGGDEVAFDCWEKDSNINEFMKYQNIKTYPDLESYYIQKIINMADELNFATVVWEEVFNNGVKLPNDTIVHVWLDWRITIEEVTKAGKMALLSSCWYLDDVNGGGDWEKFYQCEPTDFNGTQEQFKLILGGEACMWGEVVNEYNALQRVWPRACAPAEKLWSAYDGEPFDEEATAKRLEEHVCRMNRRGIPAQPPNAPGFCL